MEIIEIGGCWVTEDGVPTWKGKNKVPPAR